MFGPVDCSMSFWSKFRVPMLLFSSYYVQLDLPFTFKILQATELLCSIEVGILKLKVTKIEIGILRILKLFSCTFIVNSVLTLMTFF